MFGLPQSIYGSGVAMDAYVPEDGGDIDYQLWNAAHRSAKGIYVQCRWRP
jgi:hypothetical protein